MTVLSSKSWCPILRAFKMGWTSKHRLIARSGHLFRLHLSCDVGSSCRILQVPTPVSYDFWGWTELSARTRRPNNKSTCFGRQFMIMVQSKWAIRNRNSPGYWILASTWGNWWLAQNMAQELNSPPQKAMIWKPPLILQISVTPKTQTNICQIESKWMFIVHRLLWPTNHGSTVITSRVKT